MAYFRNIEWKDDNSLKEELETYVRQGIKRAEILDFVKRDFSQYARSFRSLCRRLHHFNLPYTDITITVEHVKEAVAKELKGPNTLC